MSWFGSKTPAKTEGIATIPPGTLNAMTQELGPCAESFKNFMRCAESNLENLEKCQWAYQSFSDCKKGI